MMLKPGMTVEIKRGAFQGTTAEVVEVCGSRLWATFEVFGVPQTQDYSYADFGLDYVPDRRPFESLLEEFDRLYRAAAPKRYELLRDGLGSDAASRCRDIPGVESVPDELIQLYQWKDGMQHLDDGWTNEFGEDGWWETTVLDNSVHFQCLDFVEGTIEMWEETAQKKKLAREPCYWRKGFVPFLEAPFWQLTVVDTVGLFGGQPHQIINFDYKSASGFVIAHENLNKWLETQVERLKAGVMFKERGLDADRVERGITEYYTRQFPNAIGLERET